MAPHLKCGVRKDLEVRLLYPPPSLAIASYGEYGPLLDRKGGVRNAKNSKFKKKRGSASA